jgi:hypothetical protein
MIPPCGSGNRLEDFPRISPGVEDEACGNVFQENRAAIEQRARQKYAAVDTETDGSVLLVRLRDGSASR